MLHSLSPIQWAAILGAVALIILPRIAALKGTIGSMVGLFRKGEDVPDIHAKVEAYQTLAADLPPDLAQKVWMSIQSGLLTTPEVPRAD